MVTEIISGRARNSEDLDFILDLAFELFKEPNGCKTKSEYRKIISPWLNDLSLGMVIAYADDVLVGFCLHRLIPDNEFSFYISAARSRRVSYYNNSRVIEMVVIVPHYRRMGIGRSLVAKVMEDSAPATSQIYATCWKGKDGDSYPLFMSLNFQELTTVHSCYYDNSSGIVVVKKL